jgi:peptidoglycan/LPS O-acetylase OafA/YrhL
MSLVFFVAILISAFSLANIKQEMLALALAFVLAILCAVGLLMLHGAVHPSEAIDTVVRFIPDALLGIAVVWLPFRWVRKKE